MGIAATVPNCRGQLLPIALSMIGARRLSTGAGSGARGKFLSLRDKTDAFNAAGRHREIARVAALVLSRATKCLCRRGRG
jgi:hypothetical protein